ncbi:hypothetical protein NQ318_008616 [Aromia moschata]|uniref:Serine proteinase stubble n=1 Tax=Aromia moschata TaxID=1265417 RepID=A0AAV8YVY5_9CUCU|nr:hypothetical protein NQ318_008616 [Aromia moschata]
MWDTLSRFPDGTTDPELDGSLGATTGRNIRNLPCISRKNNNQHGVCMFAIDCLKANGTHLGTCIDRFYFGSCCHVPPVHDIIDNTIESDIIPAREPPASQQSQQSLISVSTTANLLTTTPMTSTTQKISTTTLKLDLGQSTTKQPTTAEIKTEQNVVFGEKISTSRPGSSTVEVTTVPQKLQTFQVVNGDPLEEVTTKSSITTASTKPSTKLTTTRPPTKKPTQTKPTTPKPSTTRTTVISTVKTTTRPKTTRPPVTKPTKTTKPPTGKPTPKPARPTSKPVRITTKAPRSFHKAVCNHKAY